MKDLYAGGILTPHERNLTTLANNPGVSLSKIQCRQLLIILKRLDPPTAKNLDTCFCNAGQRRDFVADYLVAIQPFLVEDDRLKKEIAND